MGRSEKRRRSLSTRFAVYFVLAMRLLPQVGCLEVLRLVESGDKGLRARPGANESSLTRARQRLGWPVTRELFRSVARPLGAGGEPFEGCECRPWTGCRWPCPILPATAMPSANPAPSAVPWVIRGSEWSRPPSVPLTPFRTPRSAGSRTPSASSPAPRTPTSAPARCCRPTEDRGVWPTGTGSGAGVLFAMLRDGTFHDPTSPRLA
ncbi:transposase domain-containing protein [Streptomyces sp. Act-28]